MEGHDELLFLPAPTHHPLITYHNSSKTRVLQVWLNGVFTNHMERQLIAALSLQKPAVLAVRPTRPLSAVNLQRIIHIGSQYVKHLDIKSDFDAVRHFEALAIPLSGLKSFSLVDWKASGSMHGNSISLVGNLAELEHLNLTADCHFFVCGLLSATLTHRVEGRSLVVNGMPIVVIPWGTRSNTLYFAPPPPPPPPPPQRQEPRREESGQLFQYVAYDPYRNPADPPQPPEYRLLCPPQPAQPAQPAAARSETPDLADLYPLAGQPAAARSETPDLYPPAADSPTADAADFDTAHNSRASTPPPSLCSVTSP